MTQSWFLSSGQGLQRNEQALKDAVVAALRKKEPARRIALVVDGIDHVTRVIAGGPTIDPFLHAGRGVRSP